MTDGSAGVGGCAIMMLFDLHFPSENSRTLDPRIREPQTFSDSQMFSRILWDENAVRFTLSDVENCQILGFSGVNRTASMSGRFKLCG